MALIPIFEPQYSIFWMIVWEYCCIDELIREEKFSIRQVDMDSNALVAGTIDYLMLLFFQILFHLALGLGNWPLPVSPVHTSSILVFIVSLPALAAALLLCLCFLSSNSLLFCKLFFLLPVPSIFYTSTYILIFQNWLLLSFKLIYCMLYYHTFPSFRHLISALHFIISHRFPTCVDYSRLFFYSSLLYRMYCASVFFKSGCFFVATQLDFERYFL